MCCTNRVRRGQSLPRREGGETASRKCHPSVVQDAARAAREPAARPARACRLLLFTSIAMLGSCCEEQEAQEAAVRARIRAATRMSEERLFGNSLGAARAQSFCKRPFHQGACDDKLCGLECGDCDSDEDEANDDPAESDPRMAHDDDEEADLLRRLRATRLAALKAAAEKAARPAMKYEYIEERALLLLLDDPAAPPTVCLVGCEEDTELSVWIDDHLTVRLSASLAARPGGLTRLPKNRRPSRRVIHPLDSCARKTARHFWTGCPAYGACPRCCCSIAASCSRMTRGSTRSASRCAPAPHAACAVRWSPPP